MKKLLALVLALVMSLSLVTISNAAFKDADKISHDEAVTVMNAVGVLVGDNNGNFNAKDNLTRAQAAKIVSYLLLGNKTAEALAGSNKFSDVAKTNWAAGFIDYCATENIVAGVGNGQFAPEGQLTGYQFAKMLLVALGYDAKIEVFTGNDWQINVSKRADQAGLFDDLDGINGNKVLTRDEAAQMAFNALKSPLIEYENKGGNLSVNGAEINIGATQPKYKTTSTAQKVTQTIFANHDNNNVGAYIVEFAEQYYPKLVLTQTTDDFGRPAYQWSYEQKDLGTFPVKSQLLKSYIGEVTGRDLYDLLGKTVVEGAGKYTFYVSIDGVTDSKIDGELFNETAINKNNKKAIGATGDGVVTEVYVNNDTKVVYICVINEYLARAAKDFDAKKDTIDLNVYGLKKYTKTTDGKTVTEYVKTIDKERNKSYNEKFKNLSSEDFALLADAKEDDAFVVTVANGELQSVVKANVVEDTALDAFKHNDNVKAGGTTYKYSSAADYDFEVLDHYTGVGSDGKINLKDKTYNIYLDTHGNLLGIDLVTAADNYVFIAGVDTNGSNISSKNYDASAIFTDGTMKTIKYKSDKSSNILAGKHAARVNTWCTYTVDKDGVYTLTQVANQINDTNKVKVAQYHDAAFTTEIDKKHIALKGQDGSVAGYGYKGVYGNDDTVYLLAKLKALKVGGIDQGIISDVDSVVTGVKNVNMIGWDTAEAAIEASKSVTPAANVTAATTSSGVYTLYKNNGYIIATVVVGEDDAASKNLVYAVSNNLESESYHKATDQWTWTRKVISDGEEKIITEVGDALTYLGKMRAGTWYQVRYNAKGEVIGVLDGVTTGTYADNYPTWSLTSAVAAPGDNSKAEYVDKIQYLGNTLDKTSKDTVLYNEIFNNKVPTMRNSTLYVDQNLTEGFYVADDAKVVFIQENDGKKTTTYETGAKAVQSAVESLNAVKDSNPAAYNYQVGAILLNGMAKVVVIRDYVDATYKGGTTTPVTPTPTPTFEGKTEVSISADGKHFELKVYDLKDKNGKFYSSSNPLVGQDATDALYNALKAAGYTDITFTAPTTGGLTADQYGVTAKRNGFTYGDTAASPNFVTNGMIFDTNANKDITYVESMNVLIDGKTVTVGKADTVAAYISGKGSVVSTDGGKTWAAPGSTDTFDSTKSYLVGSQIKDGGTVKAEGQVGTKVDLSKLGFAADSYVQVGASDYIKATELTFGKTNMDVKTSFSAAGDIVGKLYKATVDGTAQYGTAGTAITVSGIASTYMLVDGVVTAQASGASFTAGKDMVIVGGYEKYTAAKINSGSLPNTNMVETFDAAAAKVTDSTGTYVKVDGKVTVSFRVGNTGFTSTAPGAKITNGTAAPYNIAPTVSGDWADSTVAASTILTGTNDATFSGVGGTYRNGAIDFAFTVQVSNSLAPEFSIS
mgnify:CR=1 FL=1